jgi:hypothetical protein
VGERPAHRRRGSRSKSGGTVGGAQPTGNKDGTSFRTRVADAERAVTARSPPTDEERADGWEEDRGGSGLRRTAVTGEWDDSLLVGTPGLVREIPGAGLVGRWAAGFVVPAPAWL